MDKKVTKLMVIIKVFSAIFAVVFFGFIAFLFLSEDFSNFFNFFGLFAFLIIAFVVFIVIYVLKASVGYRKKLMSTKVEQRFKYLDSFYYSYVDDENVNGVGNYSVYHVLQDISSQKIYAIAEDNTNVRFLKEAEDTKLLRIDNINGFSMSSDWKEVSYNDEGSLWIDEELNDFYEDNGVDIVFKHFGVNQELVFGNELHNRNSDYDISLLRKAIFITGYAQFDAKE